jgi:DNA polymerase-3 subunit delta'
MTQKALTLGQIICQDTAIGRMQGAFAADKMAHAYIFSGPDGVGRATTAKAWGKMLLCQNRITKKKPDGVFNDSCGNCPSCLLFDGEGHPDFVSIYKELREYTREGKGKKPPVDMPIDVIREFLIERLASRPQMGDYVVYVVHEAEKLNNAGQNALLKTLEEPPGFCVIILLCTKADNLLPTIHSRCQTIVFGPVEKTHIVSNLKERGVMQAAATFWAGFCDGSLGHAINWATLDCGGKTVYDIKKEVIQRLGDFRLTDTIEFAEWLAQAAKMVSTALGKVSGDVSTTDMNRRGQKLIVQMILLALSDAMRVAFGLQDGLVNSDQLAEIGTIAAKIGSERLSDLVLRANQKIQWIDSSVNEKLIFEGLLLNVAGLDILSVSSL